MYLDPEDLDHVKYHFRMLSLEQRCSETRGLTDAGHVNSQLYRTKIDRKQTVRASLPTMLCSVRYSNPDG